MDITNLLFNAGGVLIGAGISYGVLKEQVKSLKCDLRRAERVNQDQEEKISALKDRGLNLVFKPDCSSLREDCQDRICSQFEEVKTAIDDNRRAAEGRHEEIQRFIGYVKAKLEQLK